ncbi:MAG: hypothetical protein C0507_23305, partial [Cyanobacteria bacterium PR.3.49]|nr:hypothetical protein [Cyanobacteria bacterium PR.3.49]
MSAEQPIKPDAPDESANLKEAEEAKERSVLQALSSEPYAVQDGEIDELAELSSEPERAAPTAAAAKKRSLGKTFGIVAILTVLSKCAGLIRDIVVLQ